MFDGLRCAFACLCLCLFVLTGAIAQNAPKVQWERGTGFPYQICATADPYVISANAYNSILVYRQSDMSIARSFIVPSQYGGVIGIDATGAAGKTMVAVATDTYVLFYDLATWTLQRSISGYTPTQEYRQPIQFSGSGSYVAFFGIVDGGVVDYIADVATGAVTATIPYGQFKWAPTGDTLVVFQADQTQAYDVHGNSLGASQNYWANGIGYVFGVIPGLQPAFAGYFNNPTDASSSGYGLMFPSLSDATDPGVFGFIRSHTQTSGLTYYDVITRATSSGYYAFATGKDLTQNKLLVDVFDATGYLYSLEPNVPQDDYQYTGLTVPTADNTRIVSATEVGGSVVEREGTLVQTNVYDSGGSVAATAQGHNWMVTNTAWSPNGALLATADQIGNVIVWDAVKGVQLSEIAPFGPAGALVSLQFAPSGKTLMAVGQPSSGSGGIDLIDVSNPSQPEIHLSFGGSQIYAQISPDGLYVYAYGSAVSMVDVYSTADGSLVRQVSLNLVGPFAVSSDGKDLIDGNGVYSAATGAVIVAFQNATYANCNGIFGLSADGSKVVTAQGQEGYPLAVVSTTTGKNLMTYGSALPWRSATFSPDGTYLYASDYQDGEIYVFNVATGGQVTVYDEETFAGGGAGGFSGAFGIAFRPDGVEWAYGRGDAVTVAAVNAYYTGPTIASVSVPGSVLGGTTVTGTVTLTGPASSTGLTVALSSNSTVATVPEYLVVPPGQSSATFTIATATVKANTTVTISATVGATTKSAQMVAESVIVTGLSLSPTSVVGGKSATGTVTVSNPAPTGGASVSLSSSAAAASVPTTVSVPAGSTTVTFTVSTVPVAANVSATLTAALGGTQKSATLTIDAPSLSSVACNPTTVAGGTNSTGTITITSAAPAAGLPVALSSNQTYASVPTTVTVASGQTSATFAIATVPVATNGAATISAAFGGATKTCQLAVDAPRISGFTFNPTPVAGGTSSVGTVTLGSPAPSGGLTITLTSGATCAVVPASFTVAAEKATGTFTATTTPVATNTTVSVSAKLNGVTTTGQLVVDAPALVSVVLSPATVTGGNDSTGTVTIASAAPTGGLTVALSSSTPDAIVPVSVTVPAGAKTATFTTVTLAVAVNASATISGSSNGVSKTAALTIDANPIATFAVTPNSVVGGSTTTVSGSISLTYAVAQATAIPLSSSSSAAASVPTSVTIAAGQKTATFPVTHCPVTATQSVTLTASPPGKTSTTTLTVNPNPIVSLTLSPATVVGGSSTVVTGTVTLAAPVAAATTISLFSLDPSAASVPASVVVPAGAKTATFTVTTYAVSFTGFVPIVAIQDGFDQGAILIVLA